jgi:hypothetical protein
MCCYITYYRCPAGLLGVEETPPFKSRSKLSRTDYSTLIPMAVTEFTSTTWWISLPRLTTTK